MNDRLTISQGRLRRPGAVARCLPRPEGAHQRLRIGLLLAMLAALVALSGSPAQGTDLGYRGIGAQGGMVSPSGWDTGFEVALHVDMGEIRNGFFLQPSLMYWKSSGSDTLFGVTFDSNLSNLALGADVLWYPAGERRGWYAGAGGYMNRLDYEVLGFKTSANRPGGNAIGGYDFALGRSSVFAEARYHVVSGFNTVQLGVGFRFGS